MEVDALGPAQRRARRGLLLAPAAGGHLVDVRVHKERHGPRVEGGLLVERQGVGVQLGVRDVAAENAEEGH